MQRHWFEWEKERVQEFWEDSGKLSLKREKEDFQAVKEGLYIEVTHHTKQHMNLFLGNLQEPTQKKGR